MMKKKWIALVVVMIVALMSCSANAETSVGDLLRFVPTKITVGTDSVQVDGYFVNMNSDCSVSDFKDFDLSVYMDGQLLVDGRFGTLSSFEVDAMGLYPASFTFKGDHSLNHGTYICDESFYCSFGARFTARWK